jgi:hypothetical protein
MSVRTEMAALIGVLAIFASHDSWAQSNDVYNFYFQKGPAPNQVIQGGGGQQAGTPGQAPQTIPSVLQPPAATETAATSTAKAVAPVEKDPHAYNNWGILLGVTRVNDDVGTGLAYNFGVQYNFIRYLGLRLQGHFFANDTATYNQVLGNPDDNANKWGGQAALVFTPIHVELLGHQFLSVSALGGIMTMRQLGGVTSDDGMGNQTFDVRRISRGFWGVGAQFQLNENVGIEGSIAMIDGGKVGQATADLVLSF